MTLLRPAFGGEHHDSADLQLPWFVAESTWLGHLAFADWLVRALRPACVVELGIFSGASFLTFCRSARELGIGTQCYGIDTWRGDEHAGIYPESVFRRLSRHVQRHYPSNVALVRKTFDEAVGQFADGSIDILHIDGLHTYEAVKNDYRTWLAKLSPRGVILFHDIAVKDRDFGVYRLWQELSARHPHFAFDHCFGLGVLGVGDNFPEPLQRLFDTSKDETSSAEIRCYFEANARPENLNVKSPPYWLRIRKKSGRVEPAVRIWRQGRIGRY
jgi:O-antigen biosynthesis protein